MTALFHELVDLAAHRSPHAVALKHRRATCDYSTLQANCRQFATGLIALGLARQDRVAVYLPKQLETVFALFGTAQAGCVFVPVNPVLKPAQVRHILRDCNARTLVTSTERLAALTEVLSDCPELRHVIVVGPPAISSALPMPPMIQAHTWDAVLNGPDVTQFHRVIDADMAAILYTSGSTGSPKGVVLSHRNLVTGAHSVAEYLGNNSDDRLLAVLPLSFDYGLSQLSTAFHVGASVVLLEHLFARDVVAAVAAERITGLAAVPPLWTQLADLPWPDESLRYLTNSGGAMPAATLGKLRTQLPRTQVFLMYGLTEAFRSTYLPPSELDRRPGSIGRAIPNAEVLVIGADGAECAANVPGELVHRGALVAMGYWNAPELTAQRFRVAPGRASELSIPEIAVWSGDTVRKDEDGYLYFIGRNDEMIKTSGYRVSPTEIEAVILQSTLVAEVVAFGIPHPTLGHAIAVVVVPPSNGPQDTQSLLDMCRNALPAFMVPLHVEWRSTLPRNPNGKYDRKRLAMDVRTQTDHSLIASTT